MAQFDVHRNIGKHKDAIRVGRTKVAGSARTESVGVERREYSSESGINRIGVIRLSSLEGTLTSALAMLCNLLNH
jgi:hypothetical protein